MTHLRRNIGPSTQASRHTDIPALGHILDLSVNFTSINLHLTVHLSFTYIKRTIAGSRLQGDCIQVVVISVLHVHLHPVI